MKKLLFALLLPAALILSCSSAKITSSWKSPSVAAAPALKKVLVLALINQRDRSLQEMMEKSLKNNMTELGYNAYSALDLYGPKVFDGMNEKAVVDSIKNFGFDAVITIVLLNKRRERKYIQPQNHTVSTFGDYYDLRLNRIDDPGYYVTDTKYFWEANLYEMAGRRLLYSAQTRSFEYETKKGMAKDYCSLLIRDMLKKKAIESLIKEEDD
jgi:hypothetical protein